MRILAVLPEGEASRTLLEHLGLLPSPAPAHSLHQVTCVTTPDRSINDSADRGGHRHSPRPRPGRERRRELGSKDSRSILRPKASPGHRGPARLRRFRLSARPCMGAKPADGQTGTASASEPATRVGYHRRWERCPESASTTASSGNATKALSAGPHYWPGLINYWSRTATIAGSSSRHVHPHESAVAV
jgi:hypothetical protein